MDLPLGPPSLGSCTDLPHHLRYRYSALECGRSCLDFSTRVGSVSFPSPHRQCPAQRQAHSRCSVDTGCHTNCNGTHENRDLQEGGSDQWHRMNESIPPSLLTDGFIPTRMACLSFAHTLNPGQPSPPAGLPGAHSRGLLLAVPPYTSCCHILTALNLLSAINNINIRPWTDSEAGGWPRWSPKGAWGSRLETWGYLPLHETQEQGTLL